MLDFVYYPVSAVLWFWHRVFGFVLGPDNGVAWALAVVFLVFTLRTLLIKPFVGQIRSQLAMKKLQPRLEEVRKKYSG
jgi:YidC/Oxa1 family membrane protein insertase